MAAIPVKFVTIGDKRFNPHHIVCYYKEGKGVAIFTIDGIDTIVDDITVEEVDELIDSLYYEPLNNK